MPRPSLTDSVALLHFYKLNTQAALPLQLPQLRHDPLSGALTRWMGHERVFDVRDEYP